MEQAIISRIRPAYSYVRALRHRYVLRDPDRIWRSAQLRDETGLGGRPPEGPARAPRARTRAASARARDLKTRSRAVSRSSAAAGGGARSARGVRLVWGVCAHVHGV